MTMLPVHNTGGIRNSSHALPIIRIGMARPDQPRSIRSRFWTAAPEAPLPRLSSTAITTT